MASIGQERRLEGLRKSFWLTAMQGGIKGQYDCIHEFSEVDYTADLRKIDWPMLIIHGDDDQIVPIAASGAGKIVKGAELKVYKGGSHGLAQVDPDAFNATCSPSCDREHYICTGQCRSGTLHTTVSTTRCHQIIALGVAAVEADCNRVRPFIASFARGHRAHRPQPPTEGPLPSDQINLTDENSRVMPVAGGGFEQCYNAQAAVAAGSLLVVAVDVVQGRGRFCLGQLPRTFGGVQIAL